MKKLFIFFVLSFFMGISLNVNAQLTGPKSIPGNYATIAAAITDLNAQGVGSGGVTFNVAAGHTETAANLVLTILTNPPTSSNQVVFQKSGGGANPLITAAPGASATADGIIKFAGADYVTFNGIDLVDPVSNVGNAAMEWGYAIMRGDTANGSQNNVIRNCTVTLQKINTASIGIHIVNRDTNGTVRNTGIASGLNSFNRIYGNTISDVYKGIYLVSSSTVNMKDIDNEVGVIGQTVNTISNFGGGSGALTTTADGIRCEGQTNLKINNNVINGGAGTSGSGTVYGILATLFGSLPNASNYEISYNQVTISASNTSQAQHGIRALANGDTARIHHNIVENCNSGQTTNGFFGITHDPVGNVTVSYIHHNIIRNNTHSGTGTSTLLDCDGISMNMIIHDNEIYGNTKTGASGSMIAITGSDSPTDCHSNEIYNNSIPNSSGATASSMYGYFNTGNNPPTENIHDNHIYNLTIGGSGTSASQIVAGIRCNNSLSATTVKQIYNNTIHDLNGISGNFSTGGVIGIWSTSAASTQIYRNKTYDITNNGASGTAGGIWVTSGASIQIYDNIISDIKAPNSTQANGVIGINCTSTTANSTVGMYDNSIYLTAAGGSTFGSSGVSVTANATATTAVLEMIGNSVINLSTPGSTSGLTAAYRRSTTSLANFASTSDSNNYNSGTPSANRLIFSDGTNNDQTLADYQTRVAPREANSVSQLQKALNLRINLQACPDTDTITVEIRSTTSPFGVVATSTGLGGAAIKQVIDISNVVADGVSYYIVVRHRNSIETWSGLGQMFTSGFLNYDFTSAASQAFGNNMVLVGSSWSFYTGDVQQDGTVDVSDVILIYNDASNFVTGYVVTDLNCDDIVDVTDILYAYNNSSMFISVIRP